MPETIIVHWLKQAVTALGYAIGLLVWPGFMLYLII